MYTVFLACLAAAVLSTSCFAGGMWAKGNTHCHTNLSDGDSPPEAVAAWYRSNGYQFVVITDHGRAADPAMCKALSSEGFLVIPGEEVGTEFDRLPVHVNAIGTTKQVKAVRGGTMVEAIQKNVDAIAETGAIPIINHPNWHYPFDHRELAQVRGCTLLEIVNVSSGCNNSGDLAHMSVEQMWDVLLSEGKRFFGVAADDAHFFTKPGWEPDWPGRAWIAVRVEKLTQEEILNGIRRGEFYSSTGAELDGLSFDGKRVQVKVRPVKGVTCRVRFIGPWGRILREVDAFDASYDLSDVDQDAYVRAKVMLSNGTVAWTQPVRPGKPGPQP